VLKPSIKRSFLTLRSPARHVTQFYLNYLSRRLDLHHVTKKFRSRDPVAYARPPRLVAPREGLRRAPGGSRLESQLLKLTICYFVYLKTIIPFLNLSKLYLKPLILFLALLKSLLETIIRSLLLLLLLYLAHHMSCIYLGFQKFHVTRKKL
jgi:hypothetical protein